MPRPPIIDSTGLLTPNETDDLRDDAFGALTLEHGYMIAGNLGIMAVRYGLNSCFRHRF